VSLGVSHDLEAPAAALVIVAHPDDAEFQVGATLAKWARAGTVVHHLVLTDGSKGTWDPHGRQAALDGAARTAQRAAPPSSGATGEVVFLRRSTASWPGPTMRGRVAEVIRRLRPDVVLGHDPWKRYRLHPDHHAAGRLCVDGIVAARDPFFHPEQLTRRARTRTGPMRPAAVRTGRGRPRRDHR
jgi:LmbE family N-acetylglucosaminyl deacetylase